MIDTGDGDDDDVDGGYGGCDVDSVGDEYGDDDGTCYDDDDGNVGGIGAVTWDAVDAGDDNDDDATDDENNL